MTAPFEFRTPSGHITITAHGWATEERPTVMTELRPIIDAMRLAFPELDNGASLTAFARLGDIVAQVFDIPEPANEPVPVGGYDTDRNGYAELAQDDLQ